MALRGQPGREGHGVGRPAKAAPPVGPGVHGRDPGGAEDLPPAGEAADHRRAAGGGAAEIRRPKAGRPRHHGPGAVRPGHQAHDRL